MFKYYYNLAKQRGQERDFNLHWNFYILAGYSEYDALRWTIDELKLYRTTKHDRG